MEFFEVINKRRSIRHYTDTPVPDEVVQKALEAAIKAPNSSNTQTWNFYWVKDSQKKSKLVEYCLNQSAARKAKHLIVATADPKLWKRSQASLIEWVRQSQAPKGVEDYYKKLVPLSYRWGLFNSLALVKWLIFETIGLFRPIMRGGHTKSQRQEVAIKSTALACENFVLAISAQGYSTCMMEGFDECRVKRLLQLNSSERVVMVISVGQESEKGTWGPQSRLPYEQVVHII